MPAKKHLIVIGGPTAVGKTAVAIELAQLLDTEIISCDSRQFYREMSIGTAKPSPEELAQVTHHFVDTLSIEDAYSVGDFERAGLELLQKLFARHSPVVLVGGSGLYIRALCEGLDDFPAVSQQIRKEVEQLYQLEGIKALQAALKIADPSYYQKVDLHNPHRLIRALSVCKTSGRPFSSFQKRAKPHRPFVPIYIKLELPRPVLYQRINDRVDQMMEKGLLEEAKQLFPFRHLNALQTVGYQEMFAYLEGDHDFETAIELIKRNTRRYAKRQETWFRKNSHWTAFSPDQLQDITNHIQSKMVLPS